MGDRAVDCARLESVCAERHRGFESPPIRPASRPRFAGSETRLREAGRPPKLERRRASTLYYVYLIESLSAGRQRYVGMTDDLKQRLLEHNAGKSPHTSKFRPAADDYIAFTDRAKAEAFEHYLKSGSGHAFASKRLW